MGEIRTGICCSGGGIRSAAYNLGALQTLEKHKRDDQKSELDQAAYLSAVSGGSYIAAAYSILETQTPEDLCRAWPAYAAGSPEEQWLRNRSSYIARGFTGKARLVLRILGGFIVNVTLLFLALFIVAQLVGWAYAHWLYPELSGTGADPNLDIQWLPAVGSDSAWADWLKQAVWEVPAVIGFLFAMVPLLRSMDEGPRKLLARWSTRLLSLSLLLFVLLVGLPYLIVFVRHVLSETAQSIPDVAAVDSTDTPKTEGSKLLRLFSVGSILSLLGALFRALWASKRSIVANLIAAVVGPFLLVVGFVWFVNDAAASGLTRGTLVAEIVAVVVLGTLYRFADLNVWSMHPFYQRRVASAFAVRRVSEKAGIGAEKVPEDQLRPLSESQPEDHPMLVVCAAANISDEGATPPGRSAISFAFTSRFVGGPMIGLENTDEYEAVFRRGSRRLSLPTAVAISGAALSPSMGKMTRRPLRFLFALGNIRLGVWMPNPRWMNEWKRLRSEGKRIPGPRPHYLLFEMLGMSRLDDRFLYVTDGGHFDNLGLVELFRLGCTRIFCFDASGDAEDTFFTLGEALAIARTEVAVEVDIRPDLMRPASTDTAVKVKGKSRGVDVSVDNASSESKDRTYCPTDHVVGTFTYANGVEGYIVLAKAGVTKDAPWDVLAFKEKDKRFPNHSTADQLFNDEKFEAYRALGRFTAERAYQTMRRIDQMVVMNKGNNPPSLLRDLLRGEVHPT